MQSLRLRANLLRFGPTVAPPVRWEDPWTVWVGPVCFFVLESRPGHLEVRLGERLLEITWDTPLHECLKRVTAPQRSVAHQLELRAPMPGLVREVRIQVGQAVTPATPVIVLEAMKMENVLFAPASGVVAEIAVAPGQPVEKGALLLRLT